MMVESYIFYRDLNKNYPVARYGKGVYIYDEEDRGYLDGSSGALVVNMGHGQRDIIEPIYEQMRKISFAHTSQFKTEVLEEYAERITEITPGDLNYSYFVSGGSEAIETSIKLARQYQIERGKPSKYKVISRWTSFHGHTLGALSVGGYASWRKPHDPNLMASYHINPPNCYHCPFGLKYPDCKTKCAHELEDLILRENPDTISAFLFEPIIGSSVSAVVAPDAYYKIVADVCRKYDILLIVDEVMCGFGRTGEYFSINHWDITPDIIVAGKGISSGYAPLGAAIISQKIYGTYKHGSGRFIHGFTYSGNPISATAGLSVLNFLQENNILNRVNELSLYLEQSLKELLKLFDWVGDIRGKGMMWGVEFVKNRETREMFNPELSLTNRVVDEAFRNQLIVYPSQKFHFGVQGDSILVAPPLIITKDEIDQLMDRLIRTLKSVENKWIKPELLRTY